MPGRLLLQRAWFGDWIGHDPNHLRIVRDLMEHGCPEPLPLQALAPALDATAAVEQARLSLQL